MGGFMARILILLIGLLLSGVSCVKTSPSSPETKKPPVDHKPKEPSPKPQNTFKELEYVYFRKGSPQWKVLAKEAYLYPDRIEMFSPRILSLGQKGLSIEARKGSYERSKQRFVFRKKVVLKTPNRGVLFTEVLYYFPQKNLLTSEAPVVLKDRGLIIKGKGFEYEVSKGKLRIKEKSRVEFSG